MSQKSKKKLSINDIMENIRHPKYPDCIIKIPEKVIDEVLAKLDEMDKEIYTEHNEANKHEVAEHNLINEKYDYLEDIFYGHIDHHSMIGGGLLMETRESSSDRRRRNEEARIAREAILDTFIRILQRNKRRIEEKKR